MPIEELLKKLREAESLLNNYLVDATEEVFEEIPEVDEARGLLIELIDALTENSANTN